MSQHDLTIANQGFPAFRADLNDALQALGSCQSGTSAPSPTFANQLWYDTTNNILKIRNEDNDAWISLLTLDQVADAVSAIGSISLSSISDVIANAITTSGTQTLTNKTLTNPVINGFTGDSSVVNIGSGQLYKDTSGNFGVGTSSPSSRLHIISNAGNIAKFDTTSTYGGLIGFYKSGTVTGYFGTSGAWIGSSATDLAIVAEGGNGISLFTNGNGTLSASIDTSNNLRFNSGYGSAAIAYGCRAWVNFNGTGTVAIRASGNVTSITDHSAGNYSINFNNSMPDASYATNITHGYDGTGTDFLLDFIESTNATNKTVSKTRVQFLTTDGSALVDVSDAMVSIFR